MAPMKYIEKVIANYSKLFKDEKLQKKIKSPLEPGDHPELDDSELLDADGVQNTNPSSDLYNGPFLSVASTLPPL